MYKEVTLTTNICFVPSTYLFKRKISSTQNLLASLNSIFIYQYVLMKDKKKTVIYHVNIVQLL